jgi:hypothetical protein
LKINLSQASLGRVYHQAAQAGPEGPLAAFCGPLGSARDVKSFPIKTEDFFAFWQKMP